MFSILIQSTINLIGFGVTIGITLSQFKNAAKVKLTDEQRRVYFDTYRDVEKITASREIVFKKDYYEALESHRSDIKLIASDSVVEAYKNFMQFVYETIDAEQKWLNENDPARNEHNYEMLCDTNGDKREINYITENMMSDFNWKYDTYKTEHTPTAEMVKKEINPLLDAMRKDLNIRHTGVTTKSHRFHNTIKNKEVIGNCIDKLRETSYEL